MAEWTSICRVDDIPVLGSRRVARAQGLDVAVFRNDDGRGVCPARPLPAQGRPAEPGHRVRHQRGLPAAQLDHRPGDGCAAAPDEGCTPALRGARWTTARSTLDAAELASHATDLTRPVAGPRPSSPALRMTLPPPCRNPLHLPLLRRRLRRDHRIDRARRSPACAATPTTRPTSAACAPRAPRCT
jgi:nitrite reductase (NADH) small subunit